MSAECRTRLVITVDTEEDSWRHARAPAYAVENVAALPALQKLFDELGAKATYLVTYPVATDPSAARILRTLLDGGNCEVGAQLHPWSTPPFEEADTRYNTMLCNLPCDLQRRKMTALHEAINRYLKVTPVSFRSGRWGYDAKVARNLVKLNYKIDSSITPFTDWTPFGGPDFSNVEPGTFRFSTDSIFEESSDGQLVEIPVTIGYVGALAFNMRFCNAVPRLLQRGALQRLGVMAILSRSKVVRKVWLSPETSDAREMIALSRRMQRQGCRLLNMTLHSPSLRRGLTPFVRTAEDEAKFFRSLRQFLIFAQNTGFESVTLSSALATAC